MVLRQTVQEAIDANILRPGDAVLYSHVLWALVHGMVSLALSFPAVYAQEIEQTMEEAWLMECQGLCQGH